MDICSAVIAPNASVLVSEFSQYGSLLDINNKIRTATTKVNQSSKELQVSPNDISILFPFVPTGHARIAGYAF